MSDDSFDESTPVGDPSSMLGRLERRLDERITAQGKRFGGKLDAHEKLHADQRVWNERVAGVDGKNGRVGTILTIARFMGSIAVAAMATAGGAFWNQLDKRADEKAASRTQQAEVVELRARVDSLEQLRTQLLLRLLATTSPAGPSAPNLTGDPP